MITLMLGIKLHNFGEMGQTEGVMKGTGSRANLARKLSTMGIGGNNRGVPLPSPVPDPDHPPSVESKTGSDLKSTPSTTMTTSKTALVTSSTTTSPKAWEMPRRKPSYRTLKKPKLSQKQLAKAADEKLTYRRISIKFKCTPSILDLIKLCDKDKLQRHQDNTLKPGLNKFSDLKITAIKPEEVAAQMGIPIEQVVRGCYTEVLRRIIFMLNTYTPTSVIKTLKHVPNEAVAASNTNVEEEPENAYEDIVSTQPAAAKSAALKTQEEVKIYVACVSKLAHRYGLGAFEAVNKLAKILDDLPAAFLGPVYVLPQDLSGLTQEELDHIESAYVDISLERAQVPAFFRPKKGSRPLIWRDVRDMQATEEALKEVIRCFGYSIDFSEREWREVLDNFLKSSFHNEKLLHLPPGIRTVSSAPAQSASSTSLVQTDFSTSDFPISKYKTKKTPDDSKYDEARANLELNLRTRVPKSIKKAAMWYKYKNESIKPRTIEAIKRKWRIHNPEQWIRWCVRAFDYIDGWMVMEREEVKLPPPPPMPRSGHTLAEISSGTYTARTWPKIDALNKEFDGFQYDRDQVSGTLDSQYDHEL